jgi:hypothetical protein
VELFVIFMIVVKITPRRCLIRFVRLFFLTAEQDREHATTISLKSIHNVSCPHQRVGLCAYIGCDYA